MYKFKNYIVKEEENEVLPAMKITISPRFEGTFNVTFDNIPWENKEAMKLVNWVATMDVWNLGKPVDDGKYEVAKEAKDILYSRQFDFIVSRFVKEVEIIRY